MGDAEQVGRLYELQVETNWTATFPTGVGRHKRGITNIDLVARWLTCLLLCQILSTEKLNIKHALLTKWCPGEHCSLMYLSKADLAVNVTLPCHRQAHQTHRGDFHFELTQGGAKPHITSYLPLSQTSHYSPCCCLKMYFGTKLWGRRE